MRSIQDWADQAEAKPVATLFRAGMYLLLLIGFMGFVVTSCGVITNPFRQAARVIGKTIDADNVIYNYEWFKRRYQAIESINAKVASSQLAVTTFKAEAGERSAWKREDREEAARLSSILLGLRQQRNDLAAEYNARSDMANRAIFKSGELPESISIE